jgi:hypothetical protein
MQKEAVVTYNSRIFLEGLRKTIKTSIRIVHLEAEMWS